MAIELPPLPYARELDQAEWLWDEQRRDDASDADAAVIRLQHRDGTGVIGWHRVEASRSPGVVVDEASKYVHELVPRVMARNLSS